MQRLDTGPSSSTRCRDNNVVTPVHVGNLGSWLHGYDPHKTKFLLDGFNNGFSIPFQGDRRFRPCSNLKSAGENISVLKQKIALEMNSGRIVGPFDSPPFKNFRVSPLGLVPKKDPGQFRLIHHLSYPDNESVNDGIPEHFRTVRYQDIDDAVALVQRNGPGCYMSKTDIENAYRIIPVHPTDHSLLGMCIEGKFYYDRALPMGLSYSCQLFEQLSTALHWIADYKLSVSGCAHILDDFFFVAPDYQKALIDLNAFLSLMSELNIPIKSSKTCLPSTVLSFVGIELDSISMEKRLPMDKVTKIKLLLAQFKSRKHVTLRDLQSLIGLLQFACSVVTPGRPFLRRLIDLTIGLRLPYHRRRLTLEAKADLHAWSIFIDHFNGKSLFLDTVWATSETLHLFTDASNVGFGGFLQNKWFAEAWPLPLADFHINIKELFPIVLVLEMWHSSLTNKCVQFHSDNLTVVHIINKQTSKDPVLMRLVRRLVLQCLKHNILFRAVHVAGLDNTCADHLSRLQFDAFMSVFPFQNSVRQAVPSALLTI